MNNWLFDDPREFGKSEYGFEFRDQKLVKNKCLLNISPLPMFVIRLRDEEKKKKIQKKSWVF